MGDINQLPDSNWPAKGLSVVRLKGGDPSFSAAAARNSKPWRLPASPSKSCPASPAAAGCAAYSGFPLTHREHAQAVTFVTGHLKDGIGISTGQPWPALPNGGFYLGHRCAEEICRQMIDSLMACFDDAGRRRRNGTPTSVILLATLGNNSPQRIEELGIAAGSGSSRRQRRQPARN